MDRRFLDLSFTERSGTLFVQTPAKLEIAPPGYCLLFVFDSPGVPSIGKIVRMNIDTGASGFAPPDRRRYAMKPRSRAANAPSPGTAASICVSSSPNQRSNVAAYCCTAIVGTMRPPPTSSGPSISSRGIVP